MKRFNDLIGVALFCSFTVAAATPQTSNHSFNYTGAYFSIETWHAHTLTNISWDIPFETANSRHLIVLSWDEDATEIWRFGDENDTSRSNIPPSWTTWSSSLIYPISGDEGVSEERLCWENAYNPSSTGTFFVEKNWALVTVNLSDSTTWWYTASLNQEVPTDTSPTSTVGNTSVMLSEPGTYFACLFVANDSCEVEECVNFTVVQPPYDFMEIVSTNVGAEITVHFNIVSRYAYPGDWGWILGGVDPSFTLEEANDLTPSQITEYFEERCWFYFGRAIELDHPFLCSSDPDSTLASLQSTSTVRSYQYGSFSLYSSSAGNGSLWFAKREHYDYAMITRFYTCGISVQGPPQYTVNTTSDFIVTAIPEHGEACEVNDGIELRIQTNETRSPNIGDIDARIYFTGRIVSISSNETTLSIRLPYTGGHVVVVSLKSGAVLEMLYVTAIASDPYAPSCLVTILPPGAMPVGSPIRVSFLARDYYANSIASSWGDDAFQAWMFNSFENMTVTGVSDDKNGSYSILTDTQNVTGTTFLFVERNSLGIPGSPFEVYFYGPAVCNVMSTVTECGSGLSRKVTQAWATKSPCSGVFQAPIHDNVVCGFVPAGSSLGRVMIASSVFAAVYAAVYLVWIRQHRETVVVKLSQPFVCQLFLLGCIMLNLTSLLYVGVPMDASCLAQPWLLHAAFTFTSSCLYMKTYRVHLIFNRTGLSRVSITDRQVVSWVLQLLAVDIFVLVIWTLVDRPRMANRSGTVDGIDVVDPVCTGESGFELFGAVLWAWKACLNIFGVAMAAKTWHCEDGVGESQSICLSVYNTTLLGLGNMAIYLLLADNRVVVLGASTLTAVVGTVFTMSVLFGPKVYRLHRHGDLPASFAERRGSSGSGGPKTASLSKRRSTSLTGSLEAIDRSPMGLNLSKNSRVQPVEGDAEHCQTRSPSRGDNFVGSR